MFLAKPSSFIVVIVSLIDGTVNQFKLFRTID
jgi:hypothetical protein